MKFIVLALSLSLCGCPKPVPGQDGGIGQKIIDCGVEAVKKCATDVAPVVIGCLDSQADIKACLLGVGSSGIGCLSLDVIACAARSQRDVVPESALMRNGPTASQVRRSARAAEFLEKSGVVFTDGR